MKFWNRRDEDPLARELRASRPEPRREFLRAIAARVRRPESPRLAWRLGLAGALTAGLLVAVATAGGFAQGSHALRQVVGLSQASDSQGLAPADPKASDPEKDQYKEERKACMKTEQARHRTAQQQEAQTHTANLEAIKSLPKDQQQAARQAEEARHREAVEAEQKLHQENMRTCREIGT